MIEQLTVVGKWMRKAGAIIAVVIDPYSRWWLEDGSAAIQNMLVASTALGYGSCWVEGDALPHEEQFKTLLYIPKGKRLLALVPVGVPAEWPTIEKRPLESVLHWQVY
jgi:nitroreductase